MARKCDLNTNRDSKGNPKVALSIENGSKQVPILFTKEKIKSNIQASDRWLYRAIIAIYNYQCEDEKFNSLAIHKNNVGFNKIDAEMLTSFGEQLKKQQINKRDFFLTERQIKTARKRMVKYAGQLKIIADNRMIQQLELQGR